MVAARSSAVAFRPRPPDRRACRDPPAPDRTAPRRCRWRSTRAPPRRLPLRRPAAISGSGGLRTPPLPPTRRHASRRRCDSLDVGRNATERTDDLRRRLDGLGIGLEQVVGAADRRSRARRSPDPSTRLGGARPAHVPPAPSGHVPQRRRGPGRPARATPPRTATPSDNDDEEQQQASPEQHRSHCSGDAISRAGAERAKKFAVRGFRGRWRVGYQLIVPAPPGTPTGDAGFGPRRRRLRAPAQGRASGRRARPLRAPERGPRRPTATRDSSTTASTIIRDNSFSTRRSRGWRDPPTPTMPALDLERQA